MAWYNTSGQKDQAVSKASLVLVYSPCVSTHTQNDSTMLASLVCTAPSFPRKAATKHGGINQVCMRIISSITATAPLLVADGISTEMRARANLAIEEVD